MTIKAIKFFKDEIRRLELAPEINGCEMTEEWKEQMEICETAKSALEKQIPKKPKAIFDEYSYFECGNCGTAIFCSDELKSHRYCLHCGQALDWSDSGE